MKRLALRYFFFLLGIFINALGIVLVTKANLGTSPISSVPYVLSLHYPWTFGVFTFILNMLFIAGQILVLRRNFKAVQFLQILVTLFFSSCIDFCMYCLSWFLPGSLVEALLSLVAGCAILGIGICIEVAPNVLIVPGEGIVQAIAGTYHIKFGTVKNVFDGTLVCIACVLSFLFFGFGNFVGLGVGTIISAILVGRFVALFTIRCRFLQTIAHLALPIDYASKEVPTPTSRR